MARTTRHKRRHVAAGSEFLSRHVEVNVDPWVQAVKFQPEYRQELVALRALATKALAQGDYIDFLQVRDGFLQRWRLQSVVDPDDATDLGLEPKAMLHADPSRSVMEQNPLAKTAVRPLEAVSDAVIRLQEDAGVSMQFALGPEGDSPMGGPFGHDPRTREMYIEFAPGLGPLYLRSEKLVVIDLEQPNTEILQAVELLRERMGVRVAARPAKRASNDRIDRGFALLRAVEERLPRPTWRMLAREFLSEDVQRGVDEESLKRKVAGYLKYARDWVERVRSTVGLPAPAVRPTYPVGHQRRPRRVTDRAAI